MSFSNEKETNKKKKHKQIKKKHKQKVFHFTMY